MTYTLRVPGKTGVFQIEFAMLKNAYAAGNIPGNALVTLEHQDFWYPLAELMGDRPAKPLLFPCPQCKRMIKARAIDRGNPVSCARCQSAAVVPNPRETRERTAAAMDKVRKKPMFWTGLVTTVIGTGLVVYPILFPEPGVTYGAISFAIIVVGVAMMTGHHFKPQ